MWITLAENVIISCVLTAYVNREIDMQQKSVYDV